MTHIKKTPKNKINKKTPSQTEHPKYVTGASPYVRPGKSTLDKAERTPDSMGFEFYMFTMDIQEKGSTRTLSPQC